MSKTLVLVRGISGAGKTTLVNKLFRKIDPELKHFEADMYFCQKGKYNFQPRLLGQAHAWCQAETYQAMKEGTKTIVVSNTSTKLWEMEPYIKLAQEKGYETLVVRLEVSPEAAAARNTHGVPLESCQKMADRFEDYPNEIIFSSEKKEKEDV